MSDSTVVVPNKMIYTAGAALFFLMAACFCAGVAWNKVNSRFTYHELPLMSGGIALIVPDKWQVVTEWDEHGRPYIKTD